MFLFDIKVKFRENLKANFPPSFDSAPSWITAHNFPRREYFLGAWVTASVWLLRLVYDYNFAHKFFSWRRKSVLTRTALGRAHTSARLNGLRFVSHREAGSGSRPFPKSNQLVLVTYPTRPPTFVRILPQLFEISFYPSFLARRHSMVKNLKNIEKILVSGSGSSSKSNQFIRDTQPTCPQSFVQICQ